MTPPDVTCLAVAATAVAWGWAAAAVGGWMLGRMVIRAVSDPGEPTGRWSARALAFQLLTAGVAAGIWWWEVVAQGLMPLPEPAAGIAGSPGGLAARAAAHVVLFSFLTAAAWVDLRHRVIPDAITVPGVLLGLCWLAVWPSSLLPVSVAEPRTFAAPLVSMDVLGAFGGLQAVSPPAWLTMGSGLVGLGAAAGGFLLWWLVCTAPEEADPAAKDGSMSRPWLSPRSLVLVLGLACLVAAWCAGGLHWRAVVSSLVGITVSAGVIWLTRAGASWAFGQEAMGMGDVTLMAMAGSWLGWQPCVVACGLAVFIGLGHACVQLVRHREHELPFGPSLCLGTATVVLWWRPIWERVGFCFERPLETAVAVAVVIALTAASLGVLRWLRTETA
jgi:prepilin signal peptidase PulO-like enzyme (type II secretory pathway)